MLPDEITKCYPKSAQKILAETLETLVPEFDEDPAIVHKAYDIILRAAREAAGEHVSFNKLSSRFYDAAYATTNRIARRELRGLAQIYGILTGQKEGDKYYPRALK